MNLNHVTDGLGGEEVLDQRVFKLVNWASFNSETLNSKFFVRMLLSEDAPVRRSWMLRNVELFFSTCLFCKNELSKIKSVLLAIFFWEEIKIEMSNLSPNRMLLSKWVHMYCKVRKPEVWCAG